MFNSLLILELSFNLKKLLRSSLQRCNIWIPLPSNNKYKVSRNIKVNDKIIKTIKKFKVENKKGTYLYGNYSVDALNEEEIKDTIYLGIRNDKEVVYINRDALVGDTVSNISRLNISYKYGKITKISWSYDFE